jgi:hypothetical protein
LDASSAIPITRFPRGDRDARRRAIPTRARGSLFELAACLDLAALIGEIDHAHERAAHAEAIRARAMLVAPLRRC